MDSSRSQADAPVRNFPTHSPLGVTEANRDRDSRRAEFKRVHGFSAETAVGMRYVLAGYAAERRQLQIFLDEIQSMIEALEEERAQKMRAYREKWAFVLKYQEIVRPSRKESFLTEWTLSSQLTDQAARDAAEPIRDGDNEQRLTVKERLRLFFTDPATLSYIKAYTEKKESERSERISEDVEALLPKMDLSYLDKGLLED